MSDNKRQDRLVEIARSLEGTKEEGNNHGWLVERFQRAVDGRASGESWCMGFVQYCVDIVSKESQEENPLFSTEHCMTLWDKTNPAKRHKEPAPGRLALWQKTNTNGDRTMQGHVGIVTDVITADDGTVTFTAIEGNTGPAAGDEREGDGVYAKTHEMGATGNMRLRGFLDVWV